MWEINFCDVCIYEKDINGACSSGFLVEGICGNLLLLFTVEFGLKVAVWLRCL